MKKLFTAIALSLALTPAIYGVDANVPAEMQKKYDNLVTLIKNANVNAFKPAFDALILSAENVAALREVVTETKTAITAELEATSDKKNWSQIAKGGLATVGGTALGLATAFVDIKFILNLMKRDSYEEYVYVPSRNPYFNEHGEYVHLTEMDDEDAPVNKYHYSKDKYNKSSKSLTQKLLRGTGITAISLAAFGISYKGIAYGIKTLKSNWYGKQQLQDKLTNLDAIDAYMTGISSATTSSSLIYYIKNTDVDAFTNELKELMALNQSANKPYIAQKNLAELEQCAVEVKNGLEQELREALSNSKNVGLKKLISGSLVTLSGSALICAGLATEALILYRGYHKPRLLTEHPDAVVVGVGGLVASWLGSKVYKYGAGVVSNGLNYQEQLREQLKNLDVIIAQIKEAQAKV